MLSISIIKKSQDAKDYFTPSGYYQIHDELASQTAWFGRGAAALELTGAVDMQRFKELLDGKIGDIQLGRVRDGECEHQLGWDLTFSAPKSLSILALIGGDERLIKAHQTAVNIALKVVEKELAKTRRRVSRNEVVEVTTGSLVAAQFLHSLSRENDPQLHTHCVIANATQRDDGQWRSLHSINFYDHKMLMGQIYRNELALQVKKLGYQLEVDYRGGLFEIKGIPKEVLACFSKRRAIIEAAADSPDARNMERAALLTRKNKYQQDRSVLQQQWASDCRNANLEPKELEHLINYSLKNIPDHPAEPLCAKREMQHAVEHLATREAVFTQRQLRETALKLGLGETDHLAVDTAAAQQLAGDKIVPSALAIKGRVATAYTTPTAFARERYILKLLEQGKGAKGKLTHQWRVERHLKESGLTAGQREAIGLIATSRDQFIGVQGFAGVGKTTMLRCLKPLIEANDYQLRACAPTHTAVDALNEETGINSRTLASFLQAMNKKQSNGKSIDATREVWIVDEASLIGAKEMADLMTCARATGSRVVLLGDKAQLGAVGWGKPFHLMMSHGMRCAVMQEIQRQKVESLKGAVESTIKASRYQIDWPQLDRDPTGALEKQIEASGKDIEQALMLITRDVHVAPIKEERRNDLVECYADLTAEERERTMVIIPDNQTRHEMMPLLRQAALQGSEQAGKSLETKVFCEVDCPSYALAQCYAAGEVVEFNKSYRKMKIKAGDRFYVVKAEGKLNRVTLASCEQPEGEERLLFWNPAKVAGNAKQAVAVFKEYQRDMVIGEKIIFNKTDRKIGVKNGDIATVIDIDHAKKNVTVKPLGEKKVTFNCEKFRYFDHAYATTAYKSQGKTVDRVLVLAESYRESLVTQKSFYVALSRAKYQAKIFTDDVERLIKGLAERPGHKSSALEQQQMTDAISKIFKKNIETIIPSIKKMVTKPPFTKGFDLSL